MDILEKVSYLKGLTDGLKLDFSTDEGKVLKVMMEILDDLANNQADIEDGLIELSDQLDAVDEDLGDLEEYVYDDFDEDDEYDDDLYEVECPECGDVICVNDEMLAEGSISCPNCGETLEFDLDNFDVSDDEE